MDITYKFMAVAKCPRADMLDFYECQLTTDEMVECETIAKTVLELSGEILFQEELAERLSKVFLVSVEVKGVHSGITVIAQ
jgi:hypothetical protein